MDTELRALKNEVLAIVNKYQNSSSFYGVGLRLPKANCEKINQLEDKGGIVIHYQYILSSLLKKEVSMLVSKAGYTIAFERTGRIQLY